MWSNQAAQCTRECSARCDGCRWMIAAVDGPGVSATGRAVVSVWRVLPDLSQPRVRERAHRTSPHLRCVHRTGSIAARSRLTCAHARLHSHIDTRTFPRTLHTHLRTHPHTYTNTRTHIRSPRHASTHMHTHTRTCTHARARARSRTRPHTTAHARRMAGIVKGR
jgi:hypothetical protein